ncbi:MAG: restriction endonuclease, partial [SAR324 cluster bacterium]|nr:restriction endonuclease [SAR324 cluster bacterium]
MPRVDSKNIISRGGLISDDFIENTRAENFKNPAIAHSKFGIFSGSAPDSKKELEEQIRNAFDVLVEKWDSIDYIYSKFDVSRARERWILPLLQHLGFDPVFNQKALTLDEKGKLKYHISHRGWADTAAPPAHTVPQVELEQPYVQGGHKRSPHDEVQKFLNASPSHLWGIVTNGSLLRVLRDYHHTSTKGYVQFDVENILRDRSYSDFRAMYRLVH